MTDYSDIGLGVNLLKQSKDILDKIDPDIQIDDGAIQGIKLMTKSVSLDKLYGQDLVVGGGSNISGSILVNDSNNVSRITMDATNGINVATNSGSVFSTDISGLNIGNVTLGNFTANKGLKYTASTNSFEIRGTLTASVINGGTITGGTISGGNISGTTITGGSISGTTITGNTISGGSISGATVTGGSISGTTISGSTIILDQSGTGSDPTSSAYLRWTGGSKIWSDSSNNIGINSVGSGGMYIYTNNSQRMFITSSNINLYPNTIFLHKIDFAFDGQSEGNIDNVDLIRGKTDIRFQIQLGDDFKFLDGDGHENAFIHGDTGRFESRGVNYMTFKDGSMGLVGSGATKEAIVPTSNGYNSLYCMESPEVWFMDFCIGRKIFKPKTWKFWNWFDWEAKPDKTFMEVTSPPYIIMPTATKGLVQVWGKRKGHENKRFEKKTKEEFEKNEKFLRMAKVDTTKD